MLTQRIYIVAISIKVLNIEHAISHVTGRTFSGSLQPTDINMPFTRMHLTQVSTFENIFISISFRFAFSSKRGV